MASGYKLADGGAVRKADGAYIPFDPANADYKVYLSWCYEGNVPDPADEPTPNQIILSSIAALEATVTPRRSREAVLGLDNGWLKNLNDQIAALRAQLTKETTYG